MGFVRFFLICIFIKFFSLSHSSPLSSSDLKVEVPMEESSKMPLTDSTAEEILLPEDLLDNARSSVWKIKNSLSHEAGTAFSIAPNLFVTNFHIMINVLHKHSSTQNVVLEQEASSSQLTIKRIIMVSAPYDLALFETKENAGIYLNVIEDLPQPEDRLFVLGYPQGKFQELKKTGKLVEEYYRYIFPVDSSYLIGSSGSPVLDERGQLVGVVSRSSVNMLIAIKPNYLEDLIKEDIGRSCSGFVNPDMCVETEIENLKKLASQGDALAQYHLADMYYQGRGVEKDFDLAFEWAEKSVSQDYPLAQMLLAGMYYQGEGTAQDFDLALEEMQKSASRGYLPAQYQLAMMYYRGTEIEKDLNLASYWLKEAASQGHASSQYILAMIYYRGEGTEQNFNIAFEWMQKSASQGYAPAQHHLALMYNKGEGTIQDFDLAFEWMQESAFQDYVPAQYNLALMYSRGEGTIQDFDLAFYWYKRAAEREFSPAQKALVAMYLRGELIGQDLELVFILAQKHAGRGDVFMQGALARMYYNGEGTEEDMNMALYWYERSAKRGNPVSQYSLAMMYYNGEGVEKDIDLAFHLFTLSAFQGYIPAREFLEDFYNRNREPSDVG